MMSANLELVRSILAGWDRRLSRTFARCGRSARAVPGAQRIFEPS